MRKNNKNNSIIFIAALFAALILLNLISLTGFVRLDLTKDKKFTLSNASVKTMAHLEDMMTVSAYFTSNLPPPYAQNARYVQDLLQEYVAKAKGKFAFEFLDPAQAESDEDREKRKNVKKDIFGRVIRESTSIEKELANLGLQPVEIRVIEGDEQQTKRAYMGLVIRYQNKHEVIPIVQNLSDLEKDLTSLMRKLVREKTPVLGVVEDMGGPNIAKIKEALGQNVTVKDINLKSGPIGDDVDALLVIAQGDPVGEDGAQKINEFLKKGKSATFLVDQFNVDPRTFQKAPSMTKGANQRILSLLKDYGVEVSDSLVADASCASLNVQEQRGMFSFAMPIKYPFVPELMNLSYESPITKGLTGVVLPFVSKLSISERDGLNHLVIARSSKVSWLEKDPLDLNPRRNWGEDKIEPDGPHDLMLELRGILPSSSMESRIVVVGTSAFIWDEFLSPSNMVLALNMVDWMLSDAAILEMRSRSFQDAPIKTDLSDGVRFLVKFGNIFGVPLLLIIYGLMRWRRREQKRKEIKFA